MRDNIYTLFLFKLLAKKGTWFTDIVLISLIRPYRTRTKLYPHLFTLYRYILYINIVIQLPYISKYSPTFFQFLITLHFHSLLFRFALSSHPMCLSFFFPLLFFFLSLPKIFVKPFPYPYPIYHSMFFYTYPLYFRLIL